MKTCAHSLAKTMFKAAQRSIQVQARRLNLSHAPAPTLNEINVTKVFGVALAAGVLLYFYRSSKLPVMETPLYKQTEERELMRNEAYLRRYKTSFIKTFIRDKGGVGQRQYRKNYQGAVPTVLIPTHSTSGDQFGAGIKMDLLGPRKERMRYFAPAGNE